MRAARILAIARRDLGLVGAGRRRLRLPLIALGLLLPAGAIPLRLPTSAGPPAASVADEALPVVAADSEVPPELDGRVTTAPGAAVRVERGPPVIVEGEAVGPALRAALDETLPGPAVQVRAIVPGRGMQLPGRSLVVVLLAVSLLTGPLAETLPGERSRGTLETLLSAAVSRAEVVTGKWLAWTLAATTVALIASLGGWITGVQAPGHWTAAVPMAIAAAVALGVWLVRGAADVVGGATIPMRVVPVVAAVLGGLAWAVGTTDPLLGALVPLGGALAVAGGLLLGPEALLGAAFSTTVWVALLLGWTARDLDQLGRRRRSVLPPGLSVALVGALAWWLAVASPATWALAGGGAGNLSVAAAVAAGGILCVLVGAVTAARDGRLDLPRPPPRVWLRAAGLGALMGLADVLDFYLPGVSWAPLVHMRLSLAVAPGWAGLGPTLLVVLGHGLLFWGILGRKWGPAPALIAWVLVVTPFEPARGLLAALVLWPVLREHGAVAAMAAHLAWALILGLTLSPPPALDALGGLRLGPAWLYAVLWALVVGLAWRPALSRLRARRLARRRTPWRPST